MLREKITVFEQNSIGLGKLIEDNLKNMLEELDLALEEEPPLTTKEGGFIKQSFSEELHEMKLIEKKANSDLLDLQSKYSQNWNKIIKAKI